MIEGYGFQYIGLKNFGKQPETHRSGKAQRDAIVTGTNPDALFMLMYVLSKAGKRVGVYIGYE